MKETDKPSFGLPSSKDEQSESSDTFTAPATYRSVMAAAPIGGQFSAPTSLSADQFDPQSFAAFNPYKNMATPTPTTQNSSTTKKFSTATDSPHTHTYTHTPTDIKTTKSFDISKMENINAIDAVVVDNASRNNIQFVETSKPQSVVSAVSDSLLNFSTSESKSSLSASFDANRMCIAGKVNIGCLEVNDVELDCSAADEVEFCINFYAEKKGAAKKGVIVEVNRWSGCSFGFRRLADSVIAAIAA